MVKLFRCTGVCREGEILERGRGALYPTLNEALDVVSQILLSSLIVHWGSGEGLRTRQFK